MKAAKQAAGGKRGRAEPAEEAVEAPTVAKPPAKRAKRAAKMPAVAVSRSAPTAEVTPTASASPKKGKARGAASKPPVKDVWSFEEAYCVKPKAAEAPERADEPPAVPESPLAVFEMTLPSVTVASPAAANMPPLASVFARVPPKAVPSDVDDAAVRAAVRAVGAELPDAPGAGTVPRCSLPKALDAPAPACAPFCALGELLAACPPEEEAVKAVAAAPVTAAVPVVAGPVAAAPRAAAAAPARPPRAHSPDLFSDSDSDCTEAVAAAPVICKAVQLPKVPAPQPICTASALAADLVAAWSEPCALAALMQRADPFLAELAALLCA